MKLLITILTVAALSAYALVADWTADASKAQIEFTLTMPKGNVTGTLKGLKTSIAFNENSLAAASIKASVDANTIESGNPERDADLKEKTEWFNTAKYPLISFASKQFQKTPDGFKVSGELTMKGITKPVEIPFTFSQTGGAGVFKGRFTIKRKDFDIGSSSPISDEVTS